MARFIKASAVGWRSASAAIGWAVWAVWAVWATSAAQAAPGDSGAAAQTGAAQAGALALSTHSASPTQSPPNLAEPQLRQDLLSATWPADMVRLANVYLQHHAQHPWAAEARDIRQRAETTARLLRRDDVQLFRSAFAPSSANSLAVEHSRQAATVSDVRRAALGDSNAALRLAHRADDVDVAVRQQVGWLQLAALLGSERAAYELALHFRRQSQPLLASMYESRAIALGYLPAPALDHHRK